jgi:hypothetical protein
VYLPKYFTLNVIHSLIPWCFLRQIHSVFRGEFPIECDLVLPLSISSILSFSSGHPVAAYVFFIVFPRLLPSVFSPIMCLKRQVLYNLIKLIKLVFLHFIVCTIFLSLTVYNTSFLTQSAQLIFSIFLKHQI